MKHICYTLATFIVAGMITSCNTASFTVVKRQHMKGYHIEIGNKKSAHPTTMVSSVDENADTDYMKADPQPVELNSSPVDVELSPVIEINSILPAAKTDNSGYASFDRKGLIKEEIKTGFRLPGLAGDDNGGGLLWTIVAILVIVWLISLLTGGWGLGNLIYLLLVIALVLIILRLLGAI